MNENTQEYDLSTLHELAIIINSKQEKLEHLKTPRPHDGCMCKYCNAGRMAEKFKAIADEMDEKATSEIVGLIDRAEQITAEAGEKKIEFKGIGTFIFNKVAVKVDDSEYIDIDDTNFIQEKYPELFNTKTTISPDKREILSRLKDGQEIDGFKLTSESYKFKYKR